MKKYNFFIREILEKKVTIEAEDEQEAEIIISKMYRNSDIVLTADDFIDYSITLDKNQK